MNEVSDLKVRNINTVETSNKYAIKYGETCRLRWANSVQNIDNNNVETAQWQSKCSEWASRTLPP